MSRSLIIGIDEDQSQTDRIIQYQNRKLGGIIDEREERNAKEKLQNIIRVLKPFSVVNPYAEKIQLPTAAKMLRKLNMHYHSFVKQITLLHQYQRDKDEQGRLIAEPEDLRMACDILFDAILFKVDDLDPTLRQFYNRIKGYLKSEGKDKGGKESTFSQREIRLALNVPKASCFRYFEELELSEYIEKTGGYANRGFKYKMVYWDNMEKIRAQVKSELNSQLDNLHERKKQAV